MGKSLVERLKDFIRDSIEHGEDCGAYFAHEDEDGKALDCAACEGSLLPRPECPACDCGLTAILSAPDPERGEGGGDA